MVLFLKPCSFVLVVEFILMMYAKWSPFFIVSTSSNHPGSFSLHPHLELVLTWQLFRRLVDGTFLPTPSHPPSSVSFSPSHPRLPLFLLLPSLTPPFSPSLLHSTVRLVSACLCHTTLFFVPISLSSSFLPASCPSSSATTPLSLFLIHIFFSSYPSSSSSPSFSSHPYLSSASFFSSFIRILSSLAPSIAAAAAFRHCLRTSASCIEASSSTNWRFF